MKKQYLFSACAVMALALTACSEDEPATGGNGGETGSTEGKYIAVAINPGSRALTEGEGGIIYEEGNKDLNENTVDQLHFLFFDANGEPFKMTGANINAQTFGPTTNVVVPVQMTTDNINNADGTNANSVLVLGKPATGTSDAIGYEGQIPSRVICFANFSDEEVGGYANQNINYILTSDDEKLRHSALKDEDGNFKMTSSSYYNENGSFRCWSEISLDNIKSTPKDATDNPVQIYIERLAAKVSVSDFPADGIVKNPDNTSEAMQITYVDVENGKRVEKSSYVFAKPTGWAVNTTSTKSFGIKRLSLFDNKDHGGEYFTSTKDWNLGVRSFWATTSTRPNIDLFIPYKAEEGKDAVGLVNETGAIAYISGNTADPFLVRNASEGATNFRGKQNFARSYATKVLVGVELYLVSSTTSTEEEIASAKTLNLMHWNGAYYTPAALCDVLKDEMGEDIVYARIEDPSENRFQYTVEFYTAGKNNNPEKTIHATEIVVDPKTPLDEKYHKINTSPAAEYWNGMSYYIVNINNDLYASAGDNTKKLMYGVVRNHTYKIGLTSFVGLGTPVPVKDRDTKVENPTLSDTYVAAKVNVLNWRVVTHSTVLQ